MEFTIYSLGNVDFLAQIMNSVAMICGTGNYTRLISVGFLIGLLFICFQSVFQGAQRINLQQTLVCFIVYLCMFGPSCTVLIEDVYRGQVRNVDNVPLGVGVSGMAISNIGYGLTQMMEQAFSDVDRTTEHGFGESLRILNELRVLNTDKDQMWMVINRDLGNWGQGQSDSQQAVRNYLSECLFVDVALRRIQSPSVLASTPWSDAEVWQSRSDAHAVYLPVTGTNQTTGIVSCSRAYDLLDRTVMRRLGANVFQDWLDERLGGVQSPDATQPATQVALTSMGLAQDKVQDFMQSLAINTIYDEAVADFYLTYHDQVSAAAVRQAQIQRNTQWASEGTMFLAAARALMAFFEGFIYAITPIMGFLIVTGAFGLGLVGKFFLLIVWIQLWLPILSITNLYINIGARSAVASALGSEPSMYAINEMWAQTATWVSTGGMMAAATPMIALFLITGSTYAFTTLTNRLGGQDHFNERSTSPDAVTTGAVMARAAAYNANRTTGVLQTGAESEMKKISVGRGFSASVSENESLVSNITHSVAAKVAQAATSGDMATALKGLSKEDQEAVQTAFKNSQNATKGSTVTEGNEAAANASSGSYSKTGTTIKGSASLQGDSDYGSTLQARKPVPAGGRMSSVQTGALPDSRQVEEGGVREPIKNQDIRRVAAKASGGISGDISASHGFEHKQADTSGEKFNVSKQSNRGEAVSNELTETLQNIFRKMDNDQLAKFIGEHKGTEIGDTANNLLEARHDFMESKQALRNFGLSGQVSLAAATNSMSDTDRKNLADYFTARHPDMAQQIEKQAGKYSWLFGYDGERARDAARLEYLANSDNRQDLATLGNILADNKMPIFSAGSDLNSATSNPASMMPDAAPFTRNDVQARANKTMGEAKANEGRIHQGITNKDNELKTVDLEQSRQNVRDKNQGDKGNVQVAGQNFEGSVRTKGQQKALRDLDDASKFDIWDKATYAIKEQGAVGFFKSALGFGDSPTERHDYLIGGSEQQSVTGLTAAQKQVVDKFAENRWAGFAGTVDDSGVRAEIKQALWGDKKLNEAELAELDRHTDAMMEHLSATAYTARQEAAIPVTNFNLAFNLTKAHNQ